MAKDIKKEIKPQKQAIKEAVCKAKYLRVSPPKIRLVVNLIRGENLAKAQDQLQNINQAASKVVAKVLKTAASAANDKDMDKEMLYIKEIRCDEGPSMKRFLSHSRGRVTTIKKRSSHLMVVLGER